MLNNKKNTFEQHDNESGSYYFQSILKPDLFSHLQENLNADICIIGGGLTGVTSALNLAKNGYNVVLLEARKLGWEPQDEMVVNFHLVCEEIKSILKNCLE